jgi:outer membrane receptor protein involved in Fe transport
MPEISSPLFAVALLCAAMTSPAAAQSGDPPAGDATDLEALLNQPVYAASKFAQDAAVAPAAVTVLTAGDIRAFGWRTIAEVLNGVRGVYFRYDRNYNYVGVRGLGRPGDFSSRLLVLVDGMRVNDNIYDQAGVGREFPLDVNLIERVEFIPGPGSALYGSNAVLGVVNIVTRSGTAMLGTAVSVELGSGASRLVSVSTGRELGTARLVLSGKAEVRPGGSLYYPEYDDPSTHAGVTDRADRETDRKLYGKLSAGEFSGTALLSERRKVIPTGAFETAFPSRATSGTDRYALADLQWQHDLERDEQLFVRANLAQYQFDGSFDYGADGRQRLAQQGRWLGVEGRWLLPAWQGQRLVLGIEAQRNLVQRQRAEFEGAPEGSLTDLAETSHRIGVFVNDEITLRPGLHAVVGVRLDRRLNAQRAATPRFALVWEARPGLVVKLLDGRAYREPNAYESQYRDTTSLANPSLRSETLHARELAIDWRALPNLRLAASWYRYRVDNLIEQQVDDASGSLIFNNVGAARAQGIEFEADYVDSSGWRARGSLAFQRTRDAETGAQLTNSPATLGKLHVSVPVPAFYARAGVEWQYQGERLTLAQARLPAHAVANLTLQIAPPASKLTVSASLYNVFDKRYADPGGPELRQDTVAQDGRQWRVQVTRQF